jgi:hypothetical protein
METACTLRMFAIGFSSNSQSLLSIFAHDLIMDGFKGGERAARKLGDALRKDAVHHSRVHRRVQPQVRVYSYLNRKGLDTHVHDKTLVKWQQFVIGFNTAGHGFYIVDVGGAKEAADNRVRGK